MLKATAGGGGRGIRVITSRGRPDRGLRAHQRRRRERAFGSGVVFLERLVTGARHVEVQVIADGQGTAWALGVRDCSMQRRNQKIIEESARRCCARAGRRAQGVRRAAGAGGRLPRRGDRRVPLPPGREAVRVPRGQHTAAGGAPDHRADHRHRPGQAAAARRRRRQARRASLPAEPGHAIEARLNAEDPDRDFAPSPGPHRPARPARRPGHPGGHRGQRGRHHPRRLRLDDREDHRLRPGPRRGARPAAPRDGRDHGDHRGRRDQQELRARPARPARGDRRQRGHRLDRPGPRARAGWSRTGTPAVALAAAAIEAYEDEEEPSRQRLLATAYGGRPQVQHETGRPLDLKLRGAGYRVQVAPARRRTGSGSASPPRHPSRAADVELERFDPHTGQITVNGTGSGWSPPRTGRSTWSRWTASRTGSAATRAAWCARPRPALVVATPLGGRRRGRGGRAVLVLESMKMETVLRAPFRARLRECLVSVGSQVETGAPLLRLEPLGDDDDAERGPPARPPRRRARPARRPRRRARGRPGRARA